MNEEDEGTTVRLQVDLEIESIDEEEMTRMTDEERDRTQTLPDIERGHEKMIEDEGTLMREIMIEKKKKLSKR